MDGPQATSCWHSARKTNTVLALTYSLRRYGRDSGKTHLMRVKLDALLRQVVVIFFFFFFEMGL